MRPFLSVSLVTFCPDMRQLAATLASFARSAAAYAASEGPAEICFVLVDNSPQPNRTEILDLLNEEFKGLGNVQCRVFSGHGNVGFGRGHNMALADTSGVFHLVLNPDIDMAEDALKEAIGFMKSQPDCGLLTPAAFWEDGSRQYLCKQHPSLLDLLLRGFMPAAVKRLSKARLDRYEMRAVIGDVVVWDPPIVSGCFMLFRGDVLRALGGFDPGYFLYFEDFDLSLRTGRVSRIAYVPSVKVVHYGGHAARKGWRHISMFASSALRFFGTHGWRLI